MTILEALKFSVIYTLRAGFIEKICTTRKMNSSQEFTVEVAKSRDFRLAEADVKLLVANSGVNVSEGGMSISLADRESLREEAAVIYSALEEPLQVKIQPTIEHLEGW